ncbi:transcriptional repressor [Sedimentibacter hydroxybenzoicus DSM 7310]|uniref:Transcriptional repressor n=1 Tax=Sedimentibacter hydroxybenzoicus DSM 7310 TaxID=1123245 RepID=A0A974BN50_SEDHY|nr:transcriptional repressor [Sedimentibacter hydroxybenzoicus]NYB75812.1 transcriptional repressor [Sedimentibacter hydroxybenzoicus DSM 7310]
MNNKREKLLEGIKKTKTREAVLSVLEHAEKPLSAMDICMEIEKTGENIWLSTVYRILELFIKKDIVNKISVMNNEMAVYELNRFIHKHYAVCMDCHKIIPMNNCPMEKFVPKIEDNEFHVIGHNVEVYGICRDCYRKK